MSSNSIYGAFPVTTIGTYHYLYRITNIVEIKHYIGIRTSKNILPQDDLGVKYFSSSKDTQFKQDQKDHPENYRYKIIIVSYSRKKVAELEVKYHKKFNVGNNSKFYNLANQTNTSFSDHEKVSMRDKDGKCVRVSINDPRIENGELFGVAKGKIAMIDGEGKISQVSIVDPRIASGELQYINKGVTTVRDSNGNHIRVDVDDPRIKTGELQNINKGISTMRDFNGNIIKVTSNDPRIKTGELVGSTKGMTKMRDSDGKIYYVSTSDPRIKTGELVGICKGLFPAKDRMGNTKLISKDSLEWKNGEFTGITKIFIYITPFGNFINDFTKIPYIKLYRMCISYRDTQITKSLFKNHKPYLEPLFNFDEIEGKTFKELGFCVEPWAISQ